MVHPRPDVLREHGYNTYEFSGNDIEWTTTLPSPCSSTDYAKFINDFYDTFPKTAFEYYDKYLPANVNDITLKYLNELEVSDPSP